jgi:hypothetical protein
LVVSIIRYATQYGNTRLAEELLKAAGDWKETGTDRKMELLNMRTSRKEGQLEESALCLAMRYGHKSTCDMLLQEAAREGRTAADVSVVVGYDHRSNADNGINSKSIAATIAAAGKFSPGPTATPIPTATSAPARDHFSAAASTRNISKPKEMLKVLSCFVLQLQVSA